MVSNDVHTVMKIIVVLLLIVVLVVVSVQLHQHQFSGVLVFAYLYFATGNSTLPLFCTHFRMWPTW